MSFTLAQDLSFALTLADAADQVTTSRFRVTDLDVQTKSDDSEVTDADLATERRLRELVAEERPDDTVYGEEYGGERQPGRQWIIDPIDGTGNYFRGVPVWATLIALVVDGEPVVGVVSAPLLARRWWAAQGSGAFGVFADGEPERLQVSAVDRLSDGFVSIGSLDQWDLVDQRAEAIALLDASHRHRMFGDFLPYMLVADGSVDVVAEPDLKPYDMAALVPIITEAGGRFSSTAGVPGIWEGAALATNGRVHDEALRVLNPR
ncbi:MULTISPECIES: inositol monophosphatase family protein [unclassified Pseudoclavibacter]|uniref:inositol monophosphatase family protein n=1 Tax=unclassified Pseudoclavibacter TaxID=2615177 RepID=UPI001300F20D|nr:MULTISPECIES: inositol monophosphatase family protein [unclassified Pseudoclavibacter]KAB1645669.1 histidinol phosphatase [Pseudoclavibacter sp. CFCC 14310]KAB1664423.1 histidinol phosphatase [Pseudoclavibacter sp. CFCC 13611]